MLGPAEVEPEEHQGGTQEPENMCFSLSFLIVLGCFRLFLHVFSHVFTPFAAY